MARLSAELGDIPHKIKPLLWSGANSIFVRDKTAHVLAEYLSAEHTEHPQATQLIIAHSHGGNIALRALHHLQKRDASQLYGADGANPFVVTLATPFIEIHQANFGPRPMLIRQAILIVMIFLLFILALAFLFILLLLFPSLQDAYTAPIFVIYSTVVLAITNIVGRWWLVGRATTRQNQLDALKDATRLGELVSAQRLLVIRAIDDEASLALALGAIFNFVTAKLVTYVLRLFVLSPILLFTFNFQWSPWLPNWAYPAALAKFIALTITLVGALMVSRLVHGRELAVSPMFHVGLKLAHLFPG